MTDTMDLAVIARADELCIRPELIARWAETVTDAAPVELVIIPGDFTPEQVLAETVPLLASVGIDDQPGSSAVMLLTGPLADIDYEPFAARCTAVYGAYPMHPRLADLPRMDAQAVLEIIERSEQAPAREDRPVVRSFDVFDTLIARRCVEPERVRDLVAERAEFPDFPALRHQAEVNVTGAPYDLDDIYAELGRLTALSAVELNQLRDLEIEIELGQVIPITENIEAVRHGDLLVSDMYLGASTIRRLLGQAGFDREVGLVVTSDGKASGRIWPQLTDRWQIERHTGDNAHSDGNVPNSFAIPTHRTTTHARNGAEQYLSDVGLGDLSELCRELRLRTWSDEPQLRLVQIAQSSLNFPMLLIASTLLARSVEADSIERVLFSSRDCFQMRPLFETVAARLGVECRADYFYTSRLTRVEPSAGYLEYARSLLGGEAIVVDICGTGWSLAHLAERLEMHGLRVFLLHLMSMLGSYSQVPAPVERCVYQSVVDYRGRSTVLDNAMFEMCNQAAHGMVIDVQMTLGQAVPAFAPDQRSVRVSAAVAVQLETTRLGGTLLKSHPMPDLFSRDSHTLAVVFDRLYQMLSGQHGVRAIYANDLNAEDLRIEESIIAGARRASLAAAAA
jgi:hypothetical protein